MKVVVYQEPYKVTVEEMPDSKLEAPNDAVVRMTTTNICGPDLHLYEGRTPGEPDFIFGHTNQGIVAGRVITSQIVSHEVPLEGAPEAYDKFDKRIDGYTKVPIKLGMAA